MIRPPRTMLDLRRLSYPMPIWVSRPEADGMTHTLRVPAWQILVLWPVVFVSALLWGAFGIYEAVRLMA
jgi:hypothetical protein